MQVVETWLRDVELVGSEEIALLAAPGTVEAARKLLKAKVKDLAPSGEAGVSARVRSSGDHTAWVQGDDLATVGWTCSCFMVSPEVPCVHVVATVCMVEAGRSAWGLSPRRAPAGLPPVRRRPPSTHANAAEPLLADGSTADQAGATARPPEAPTARPAAPSLGEPARGTTNAPYDPGAQSVWDRLCAARDLAPREVPCPFPAGQPVLSVASAECRVSVVWPHGRCRRSGLTPRIGIALDPQPGASCACGVEAARQCGLARAACEVALAALATGSPTTAPLAALLATPQWRRALDAHSGSEVTERRLAVELDLSEAPDPTVTGVRVVLAAPKRRGEGWSVTRATRAQIDELVLLPAERAAALLLSGEEDPRAEIAAVALLAGQGLALADSAVVRISRARLTLRLRAAPPLAGPAAPLADSAAHTGGWVVAELVASDDLPPPSLRGLLASPVAGTFAYADKDAHTVRILEASPALWRVAALLEAMGPVPTEALEALLRHLADAGALADTEVDGSLVAARLESRPEPLLRLEQVNGGVEARIGFLHHRDYPVLQVDEGPSELFVRGADGPVRLWRNRRDEAERAARVRDSLGLPAEGRWRWRMELDAGLDLLRDAGTIGVPVEWAGPRLRVATVDAPAVSVRATGRGRWFTIGGHLRVDDAQVPLELLLRALAERRRFIEVSPGSWVALAARLREPLAALVALQGPSGVPDVAAPLAQALAEAGAEVEGLHHISERLAAFEASRAWVFSPPPDLRANLRPYQRAGVEWLARLATWAPGACLCDDMGLGKTLQTLALLLLRAEQGPALVVAPMSLGFNWQREAGTFAPALRVTALRGRAELNALAGLGPFDVAVASYELVAQNPDSFGRSWATLVLDEAQAVKNAGTQRARAIHGLDAQFRVALTGTPVENRVDELWSVFTAAVPGLLGSQERFRERFTTPIEKARGAGEAGARAATEARMALAAVIRPFLLRRLKRDVATDLPPRTDVRLDIELSPEERSRYDQLRLAALAVLEDGRRLRAADEAGDENSVPVDEHADNKRRIQVLAALTRLRQAACHPRLLDPTSTERSSKLDALLELLGELRAGGHRALVFSQFARHLGLVAEALDAAGYTWRLIDGGTPAAQRRKEVDAFQAGHGDVFLISLKAGGTGLNLTAADYVVHLDPWWNPAIEDQATDRAHRIGQTRPVTVYRLVARDTVEDAIVGLHDEKRALVSELLAGAGQTSPLSTEELLALLSAGAA